MRSNYYVILTCSFLILFQISSCNRTEINKPIFEEKNKDMLLSPKVNDIIRIKPEQIQAFWEPRFLYLNNEEDVEKKAKSNKISFFEIKNGEKTLYQKREYQYDKNGNLWRDIRESDDMEIVSEYLYDEDNFIKIETIRNAFLGTEDVITYNYIQRGEKIFIYGRMSDDKLVYNEIQEFRGGKIIVSDASLFGGNIYYFQYNDNEVILTEYIKIGNEKRKMLTYKYYLKGEKAIKKIIINSAGELFEDNEYQYNNKNGLLEKAIINSFYNKKEQSKYIYKYYFDGNGNWIVREEYDILDNGVETNILSEIIEREIAY